MKKIIGFLFLLLSACYTFAQNYRLEYDVTLHLVAIGGYTNRYYIWSADYTTFTGKTGSLSEFTVVNQYSSTQNYRVSGSRLLPVSNGFIKNIIVTTSRQYRNMFGWQGACSNQSVTVYSTAASSTTCFSLQPGSTPNWACLNSVTINRFQCYPDLSIDLNPPQLTMTNKDKLVVQATSGFPSQVYKWKYSTTVPDSWRDVPASCFVNGRFEASAVDLFGEKGSIDMGGKTFRLCIDLGCNRLSNIRTVDVKWTVPGIASIVTENAKCPDESNGSIVIGLDRDLMSGEAVDVQAYRPDIDVTGNSFTPEIIDSKTLRIDNLPAGVYKVAIFSHIHYADGSNSPSFASTAASTKDNVVISEPSHIDFDLDQKQSITCNGGRNGSFKVKASGGTAPYKIQWKLKDATVYNETNNMEVDNLPAGDYVFTVTDANGCELKDQEGFLVEKAVQLTEPEAIILTEISHVEPSGNGMSNGSITVQVQGGTPAYSVVWKKKDTGVTLSDVVNDTQNGILESTLNNIPAGDYTITVTDFNGCVQSIETITMDEPFAIKGNIIQTGFIACYGDANASLEVTDVEGGVPGGFSFAWYRFISATDSVYLSDQTSISDLVPGRYAVTIKDTSSPPNIKNLYYDVSEPDALSVALTSINNTCYDGNDGAVTVNVSGGTMPYVLYFREQGTGAYNSVSFSNAQYKLNGLFSGTYEIYVSDKNNCPALIDGNSSETITIMQPENEFFVVSQRFVCPSGASRSDGRITIKVDGGLPFATDPKYQAVWRNESDSVISSDNIIDTDSLFTSIASSLPKGIYTVQINGQTYTGAAGPCTLNLRFELVEPLPLSVFWTASPIDCHGNNNGKITVQANGGVPNSNTEEPPYLYEWYLMTEGMPELIPGEATDSLTGIGTGQYRVKVTDYSDPPNIKEFDYTLTEPDELKVTVTNTPVSCFEGSNGAIKVNLTGGTPPYRLFYKKDTIQNYSEMIAANGNFTVADLLAGDYELYVKDNNECSALINNNVVDTVTVTQPEKALEVVKQLIRFTTGEGKEDGYITLTIDGGTPFTSGPMYKVIWSDEFGNTIDADNSNENSIFTTSITDLPKGSYLVEISDSLYYGRPGGCVLFLSMIIEEPGPVIVELENTRTVDCFGDLSGELVAHASGGLPFLSGKPYTYKWYQLEAGEDDEAIDIPIENGNDSILSGIGAGIYMVRVEDSLDPPNTNAEIPFFEITQPPLLSAILKTHDISCFGGRNGWIDIAVNGGVRGYVMYAMQEKVDTACHLIPWNENESRFLMDSLIAGVYKVYIQDANLCYAKINGDETAEITLKQPNLALTIDSVLQMNPSKFGASNGSVEIRISGGTPFSGGAYTVVWKDQAGNRIAGELVPENGSCISKVSNLPEGSYSVEVRDSNYYETDDMISNEACIATDSYTLMQPEPFEGRLEETVISCHGQSDGALTTFIQGGVKNSVEGELPYKFQWYLQNDNDEYIALQGENDSILSYISGGNYRVVIMDYSWLPNILTLDYHLIEPEVLKASATDVDILCGETASIAVDVSGGTPPYTYQWNTGAETSSLSDLYPGVYMVFVTDSHGCSTTATAHVTSPGDVKVTGEIFDPVCYHGNDGEVIINASGGTAPYTYHWSDGSTNRDLLNVKAGIYTVSVIDRDGCACSESFILTDPEPVKLDLGGDQILCVGQTYEPEPVYDDPASTFEWTSDNGFYSTEKHVVLDRAGTYRLTITDSKGCQATDEMHITTKDYNISCEMAVNPFAAMNDTLVLVNISYPEPDRIEWLFSPDDPVTILETTPELAMVIFTQEGEYNVGMRSYVSDCYMDMVKTVTITPAGSRPSEDFGTTDIKKFIAYPNPNQGVFKVDVELNRQATIRLRLISLAQGAILDTRSFSGSDKYSIDYSETLTFGGYILLLETPTSQRSLKLIIY